ncbi:MAG: peptidase domain-containing ABC transporter [Bacilli bacterium]|nr:peptidase domain-containing ABC transporter [Bacilli bacterium]
MKVVLQDGIKDCGICCLLSIIKHYNGKVSKEYLRQLTNTTKNGVSLFNLLEASKKIGFEVEAVKGDIEKINADNLPCIAHVIINKSHHHFIVIYKIDEVGQKILVMDPSQGKRTFSTSEFKLMTSNHYLFLKPIQKLPIFHDNKIIRKSICLFLKKKKHYILFLFFLTIFYFVFNVFSSYHFKYLIDYGINYNTSNNLGLISFVVLFIYLLKEFSSLFRKILLLKYGLLFDQSITIKTLNQLILLPYLYYKNRTTGEVITRVKDLSIIKEYLTLVLLFVTTDLVSILIFIILLFNINKKLSVIALFLLLFLILISIVFKRIAKQKTERLYREEEQINSFLIETLSSVEAIKGMHIEFRIIKKFIRKYRNFLSSLYSLSLTSEVVVVLKSIVYNIFMVIILYYGSSYIIKGQVSLSDIIVFQSILSFYTNSFQSLINIITEYPRYKVASERIEDLFTIKKEVFQGGNYYKLYSLEGDIFYHNLTYSYNGKLLLDHINLTIRFGEKIFLYGPSGVGKSTLIKILMRYIEVPFNSLSVNGIDINHYHLDVLREHITYISQQEFLFNDTILNNIRLYRNFPKEEVQKVMNLTLVDEVASMDKLVEENGFNFSGGERQRIVLARSILKKSDIYIFDEAFSQIDTIRERKILLNIFGYLKNKTIIVISHRFDNKELFDRVIALKNGQINEEKL